MMSFFRKTLFLGEKCFLEWELVSFNFYKWEMGNAIGVIKKNITHLYWQGHLKLKNINRKTKCKFNSSFFNIHLFQFY